MIYDKLADIYDGLVKDDEATNMYVTFLQKYLPASGKCLELGCGSGEITIALATNNPNLQIEASDLSPQMIEVAKNKNTCTNLDFKVQDMRELGNQKYDAIYCICDSINYLTSLEFEALLEKCYEKLLAGGILLFDMHSLDRLDEFSEEFYEAGIVDGVDYTWSIVSDHNDIIQNFIFYDEAANRTYEHHIQHVFDPNETLDKLQSLGFETKLFTDFDLEGIQPGEKYFLVARKKEI